jgi:putative tryptophan/tyrosine transport system substrate-binding protein
VIDRRTFLGALTSGLLAAPLAVEAQQAGKVPRVGVLSRGSRSDPVPRAVDAVEQGLRELGYVEGQSIAIEYRFAEGKAERLPDLATELVRLRVDVIVATVAVAVQAAKHATKAIPIVMVVNDPVAAGFVASVARPGGNITGLSMMMPEVVAKQLELLREVVPKISRVAVLGNPANPGSAPQLRQAEVAARALGVRLQPLEARGPSEIDRAFAAMTRERASAFLVLLDPMLADQRERIADLAAKSRLPAMYALRLHVEAGGLMAYGANIFDLYRRTAIYVDKILKGAKPADMPIEQPTKFELVINRKAAKALGLTIPSSLLQRADQVIE